MLIDRIESIRVDIEGGYNPVHSGIVSEFTAGGLEARISRQFLRLGSPARPRLRLSLVVYTRAAHQSWVELSWAEARGIETHAAHRAAVRVYTYTTNHSHHHAFTSTDILDIYRYTVYSYSLALSPGVRVFATPAVNQHRYLIHTCTLSLLLHTCLAVYLLSTDDLTLTCASILFSLGRSLDSIFYGMYVHLCIVCIDI